MSSLYALRDYLMTPVDLPGPPAVPFITPRIISGVTVANRNDARRLLRDRIGDAVHIGRRKQRIKQANALTLSTSSTTYEYGLHGTEEGTEELVIATVACLSGDAARRSNTIAQLLSLAVSGWSGGYWGDLYVGECLVDGRSSRPVSPVDGSDNWTYEETLALRILYGDPATPVYPATPLVAVATFGLQPGVGPELRLSAAQSIVPEGRSIANVAWEIRSAGPTGSVLVAINGAPAAAVTTANVTGTYLEPAFSRASFSLSGAIYTTLTVTDSAGIVATYGVLRNE
jgi:hypothetical protein